MWECAIIQVNKVRVFDEWFELSADVVIVSEDRLWVDIYEPKTEVGLFRTLTFMRIQRVGFRQNWRYTAGKLKISVGG